MPSEAICDPGWGVPDWLSWCATAWLRPVLLEADRKLAPSLVCFLAMSHYHQTSNETLSTNPVPSMLRLSLMKLWSKHLSPSSCIPLSYIVPAPKRCSSSPVNGRIVSEGSFVFSRFVFLFFFSSPPLLALPWMSQTSIQLLLSGLRLHPGECIGR